MNELINILQSNNLEALKVLLANEPRRITDVDENGIEMTFIAARTGNMAIVRFIVEYSMASFNTKDPKGRTCLHYAVESGNLPVVKYFVEKVGLSPVDGDYDLVTPFQRAFELGMNEIELYFEQIVGSKFDNMYQNPIRTGMFPDPSIVRVGEDYYMVNSTFVYFPCIPISHSKDLINWKIIGHTITNPEWANLDGLEGGRGYWAPDISYYEGRFYIAVTYRMNDTGTTYRKQVVMSSDKPEGPYTKPAFIDEDGIDPSIFNDDDGKRYMLLNRGGRIFEISKDGTKQLSEANLLFYGDNKRAPEAPHLLKKDGWYYLFLAEGGTGRGHKITVARSRSLFGNYEPCPYNPIMTQTEDKEALQCCGHGKPVMTQNGDWYMVYLCNRYIDGKYGILGRETAMDPITWTADGWPIVNKLKGPSALQRIPNLPNHQIKEQYLDLFEGDKLGLDWMFPRAPEKDGIQIADGCLLIKGSQHDMNSIEARNIVLQRQRHFNFNVISIMKFPNLIGEQNAGLICYYDENTFLKYGIYKKEPNEYLLQVIERIGEEENVSLSTTIEKHTTLYLQITTRNLRREFLYSYDNKNWISLGYLVNVNYLCSEGYRKGKRFTGATVGMYAYGGEETKSMFAEFDSFEYIPLS